MADVTINYKGSAIATMSASGTKTLRTEGQYCEDDIEVVYASPGGGGSTLGTKAINANGTYNASSDNLDGYSQVSVDVPTGTPRSSSDLTANNLTVTAPAGLYAEAASKTLSDQNLVAGNIKKDVTIFGTTGTYEGGGGVGLQWSEFTATLSASNAQECRDMLFPNLAVGEMQIAVQKNPDSSNFVANQLLEITVFRRSTTQYDGSGLRYKTSGAWTFAAVSNTYDAVISVGDTYYVSEEVTLV